MDTFGYDPMQIEVRANPYPYYAILREKAPVCEVPSLKSYVVSRYDDVIFAAKRPDLFSSDVRAINPLLTIFAASEELARLVRMQSLLFLDPPAHTRVRALVNRAFTSSKVNLLEPQIREITRGLLRDAVAHGALEIVADLASPLPVIVIAEMLGVEPGRQSDFGRWTSLALSAGPLLLAGADPTPIEAAMRELRLYLEEVIEERRRAPRNDLISELVQSDKSTNALTSEEVFMLVWLLLVAGNETTTKLISNALLSLLDHPSEMAVLRQEPALIPNALEEVLRFDSPAQALYRVASQDVEIAGVKIPAGASVLPLVGSANRDPQKFPAPDTFDVRRDPQGHLSFGFGIHFCLGAPLARLEARVALEELLAVSRDIAYAPGQHGNVEWSETPFLRGPKALRMEIAPI